MKKVSVVAIVSLITCAGLVPSLAHETVADKKEEQKLTVADYETRKIHGWTVHVEKTIQNHPRHQECINLLDTKLAEIVKLIHPEILVKLRDVPIWLNNDIRRGACYHPNPKWLEKNNRMAEKAHSIEFQSVDTFVDWSKSQPMMVLHELAHAYHHRVYQFKQPEITKAFQQAVASKTYEKVKHVNGKEKRHYALSNEKEYFAECTEAYFGKNDFYPFTREELKKHDPAGYAMVESVWKVKQMKR